MTTRRQPTQPAQWKVCPARACTRLVNPSTPCPDHARPSSASWSTDRNRQAQRTFRAAVLERDAYACVRCPHVDPSGRTLVAHHWRPGYHPDDGATLCHACHAALDNHAR